MTTTQTVTQLGKIILNKGTMDLPMYCSEFAWHMLALSNCTEADILAAGPEGASCVKPVFAPMQLAATDAQSTGLAEGPLVRILAAAAPPLAPTSSRRSSSPATPVASPPVTAPSPSRSRRSCPASRSTTARAPRARPSR